MSHMMERMRETGVSFLTHWTSYPSPFLLGAHLSYETFVDSYEVIFTIIVIAADIHKRTIENFKSVGPVIYSPV